MELLKVIEQKTAGIRLAVTKFFEGPPRTENGHLVSCGQTKPLRKVDMYASDGHPMYGMSYHGYVCDECQSFVGPK